MSEPKQPIDNNELSLKVNDLDTLLQISMRIESELGPIYRLYQDQRSQLKQVFEQPLSQIERVHQSPSSETKAQPQPASTAFLWNREGFTPIPSLVDTNDLHISPSNKSNVQQQQSEEVTKESTLSLASQTQGLVSEVFEQVHTQSDDQQQESIIDITPKESALKEVISNPNMEEVEPFIPFVERLQQSQVTEEQNLEREEPDSSIPHSLDEIYSVDEEELISNVQGTAVAQALSINSKSLDPELHVALAPASLRQYRRTPWQKIILVCLFCLLFGGLVAYLYLYELASFME